MVRKSENKKRVRRTLAFWLVFIMAFMLMGCGKAKDESSTGGAVDNGTGAVTESTSEESFDEAAPAEGAHAGDKEEALTSEAESAGESGSTTSIGDDGIVGDYGGSKDMAETDAVMNKFAFSDSIGEREGEDIGIEEPEPYVPEITAKAGTLTAGEWDDNENWGFYKNLFAKSSDYYAYKNSWGMNFEHRIRVKVTDGGKAVKLAKVSLLDGSKKVIWGSVSRYDGYADVFYSTDKGNEGEPKYIRVEKDGKVEEIELEAKKVDVGEEPGDDGQNSGSGNGDKRSEIKQPSYEFDNEYEVVFSGTKENEKKLDLMFVVDTTGSMSDEITFLQTELKDVINTVKQNNSNIKVRISMNFYKDEGDKYVVDSHGFTSDIEEAQKLINSEYADGGGDYPEAVHTAVNDAVFNHDWDKDSVKVMFLLLDAPPHEGKEINESLAESLSKAGSEGIHIIPVAASGIDKQTEFLLRAMAVSTDGTYVFLTDDSGVGGSHITPTVGDYDVELLNELMVRLINKYLG